MKTKRPLYSTKEKVHWSRLGNWWSGIKIAEHVERTERKRNKKNGGEDPYCSYGWCCHSKKKRNKIVGTCVGDTPVIYIQSVIFYW